MATIVVGPIIIGIVLLAMMVLGVVIFKKGWSAVKDLVQSVFTYSILAFILFLTNMLYIQDPITNAVITVCISPIFYQVVKPVMYKILNFLRKQDQVGT